MGGGGEDRGNQHQADAGALGPEKLRQPMDGSAQAAAGPAPGADGVAFEPGGAQVPGAAERQSGPESVLGPAGPGEKDAVLATGPGEPAREGGPIGRTIMAKDDEASGWQSGGQAKGVATARIIGQRDH